MDQNTSYKFKKALYYPAQTADLWNHKAYLCMSMSNTRFRDRDSLKQVIQWIGTKTAACDLIVGDYLDRHNQQIIQGLDEQTAAEVSLKKGQELTELFKEESKNFHQLKFRIRPIKEFYDRNDFEKRKERLLNVLKNNTLFSESIEKTIDIYFARLHQLSKLTKEETRKLSRHYIIEEMVVYEMLEEEGLLINIYPGSQLLALKEIVMKGLPGISQQLERINLIELKFRKTK